MTNLFEVQRQDRARDREDQRQFQTEQFRLIAQLFDRVLPPVREQQEVILKQTQEESADEPREEDSSRKKRAIPGDPPDDRLTKSCHDDQGPDGGNASGTGASSASRAPHSESRAVTT